ncbi:MAG: transcription elongation factor GreA [Actinobacteria bacterium]|nr:transcription elongation factor GreA [Actinomycetota bacterium]
MSEEEIFLTTDGHQKLLAELDNLINCKRKEVAARIKEAISFGDISENSEYEDAKNEQAFVEGRIIYINKLLSKARIIEENNIDTNKVALCSVVTLLDLIHNEQEDYMIVGSVEADPGSNKISNESPVGKAILGKKVGQIVTVDVPRGELKYKIIDIRNSSSPKNSE